MSLKFAYVAPIFLIAFSSKSWSWDGYNYQTGSFVEIDKGNKVREGEDIEYYDSSSGTYKNATVDSVSRSGSTVEVEVTDNETGETTTLDMD